VIYKFFTKQLFSLILIYQNLGEYEHYAIIKSRRMRLVGHMARMGKKRNVYRLLVGKPEGNRPLGRPRHRWILTIKMDLLEIGLSVVDWIGLVQDRYRWRALVNVVMNLRVT
jgi:hypothetical protein